MKQYWLPKDRGIIYKVLWKDAMTKNAYVNVGRRYVFPEGTGLPLWILLKHIDISRFREEPDSKYESQKDWKDGSWKAICSFPVLPDLK